MAESSAADSKSPFVSGLGKGREAFHSEVTEYALRSGERTADDFLRHFSCRTIMQSLDARPTERSRIISESTGVHEKVAHKMSSENSGEALQIALEEGVTTAAAVVKLFNPDDKQRYLGRHELWAFDIEGQPWKTTPATKAAHDRAKAYIAYILDRALENLLVSHEEVVQAITVTKLSQSLPKDKLGAIIEASLKSNDKFTEEDLLAALPPQSLVDHLSLEYLWDKVVVPLVAEPHDYLAKPGMHAADKKTLFESKPSNQSRPGSLVDNDWAADSVKPVDLEDEPPASSLGDGEVVSEDEILDGDDDVPSRKLGGGSDGKKPRA